MPFRKGGEAAQTGRRKRKGRPSAALEAIPMVQARRKAADLGAAERRAEVQPPFRLAATLRGCAAPRRPAAFRRGWREAGRRVMMKRLHLEVVLRDAAAAAGLPTQPHAPRALEKAHVRLATHYLAAGEHALCKAHLDEVLRGRAAYAWYAHAPLDAAFYRCLAVLDERRAGDDLEAHGPRRPREVRARRRARAQVAAAGPGHADDAAVVPDDDARRAGREHDADGGGVGHDARVVDERRRAERRFE